MEPVIKYEFNDEQYEKDPFQVDNTVKKNYDEQYQTKHLDPQRQHTNLNVSPPALIQINNKTTRRTSVKPKNGNVDRTIIKKSRKEKNILFNPPFYQLLDDIDAVSNKDGLSARCCTCRSVVRGSKNVSSNFIKHLRRSHPTVKKMYDTYKIHRIEGSTRKTLVGHDDYQISSHNSNNIYENEQLLLHTSETRDDDFNSNLSEIDLETVHNSSENSETNATNKTITPQCELVQSSMVNTENALNISNKTLHAISQMLDEKLNNFVTKGEFKKCTSYLQMPSLENEKEGDSSHILNKENELYKELNEKVAQLQYECQQLRWTMQQSQTSKWQLQNEINALERNLNQRKLVIKNLTIADPLQLEKSVETFIEENLGLEDITLLNVTLLPNKNMGNSDIRKENILIELKHIKDVKKIFQKAHKLKNTGVYIEKELSRFQRKRKEKLLVLRKEILRRKSDIAVTLRNSELIVEGQTFYWDDIKGLCHLATNDVDTSNISPVDYLKTLTDLDLEEFINVLKNYNVQIR